MRLYLYKILYPYGLEEKDHIEPGIVISAIYIILFIIFVKYYLKKLFILRIIVCYKLLLCPIKNL